jgi:CheY-like chemotaxis protein
MPEGGTITITAAGDDNGVTVRVTDSGSGIPADQQALIFDPFFTTREAGDGTGLGLAICHSLIQQNDGSITVDSTPGIGTTFTIRLPAAPPGNNSIHRALQGDSSTAATATGESVTGAQKPSIDDATKAHLQPPESRRVLLVEPDNLLAEAISNGMHGDGFEIEVASDINEGINMIKHRIFNALIVDDDLGESGWSRLVRWVNRIFNRLPVILLAGPESTTDGQSPPSGITAICRKPFAIKDLETTVRRLSATTD